MIHEHELYALSESFHHCAPCNLQIGRREELITEAGSGTEACTVIDEVSGDVYRVARTHTVERLSGVEALQAELEVAIEMKDFPRVARLREELRPHAERSEALLNARL
jgi:hypothetical protein